MRNRSTRTAAAILALALAGGMTGTAAAEQRPTVDGVWRVAGYGTVLSIADGQLQEYQTTAVSCLQGDSAKETARGVYRAADGTVLTVRPTGSLQVAGPAGKAICVSPASPPITSRTPRTRPSWPSWTRRWTPSSARGARLGSRG
ncbi:hypothetical protein GCM10010361_31910 [Streptomyces olivaceiscleroticus]|uniref:Lipocalin-like domain-containing protein n=1 Tax=Streptomyces olivaceiscleroticus TaxID=68245 RepID=A0ABP3JYR9_9ACTN